MQNIGSRPAGHAVRNALTNKIDGFKFILVTEMNVRNKTTVMHGKNK